MEYNSIMDLDSQKIIPRTQHIQNCHNIFVPTRLDTRDIERTKQLTAQYYKQLESTPNEVTGELLEDLLKFNPQFKIPNNLTVNGNLYLSYTKITSLPDNLTVNGNLFLRNTKITSLPNNLIVNGYLDLSKTLITSLPDNLTVNGTLDLGNTLITSLPDNLTVNGNLDLSYTKITSLPDNLTVKGGLYLSNTPIAKNEELLIKYKKKYKIRL